MNQRFKEVARVLCPIFGILFVFSCSAPISVSVVMPEEYFNNQNDAAQVYLLSVDEYTNILNIKTRNQQYYREKLMTVADSLNKLNTAYESLAKDLISISKNCSTMMKLLPIEYCEKIEVVPTKILRYGDVWQLSASLNNLGEEDIWGLVLSLNFKDIKIIDHREYSVFLRPGQTYLFKNITFDLSNNLPLQYSIVSYPGGTDRLLNEALTVEVDSVISMFSNSMSECRQKSEQLNQELEAVGITIDLYSEEAVDYLDKAVIKPVNRILEENLKQIPYQLRVTSADTVTFNDLKQEKYYLFVFSDIDTDSTQYSIPIDLITTSEIPPIDIAKCHPTLIFMNKNQFMNRIDVMLKRY